MAPNVACAARNQNFHEECSPSALMRQSEGLHSRRALPKNV
jgi:hypothetical protein